MTSFSVAPLSNLFARGINRFVSVVEKKRSASIRSFSCLLLAFACLSQVAWGQVTVTVTGESNTTPALNASYSSLASAITALNSVTAFSGPVVLTCATGTETAPAGGYAINFTGATSSTNNVIITTAGTVTITAPNPQTSGSLTDAIFKIIGSDWVTISGFTMLENASNTTTTAGTNNMTEWGVALLYASATNGAQNCTIRNNIITLNRTYQNSFGIYANSTHTATLATTSATATGAGGGASGLKVYSNTISNVNNGIVVVGPTAAADANTGIDIGGTSLATGNTLTNYGTTGTFSAYANVSGSVNGILVRNSIGFNIAFNSITSSNGGVTAGTLNGIQIPAASNAPTTTFTNSINSNVISLQSGLTTGSVAGITYPSGSASTTSSVTINQNNFTRLNYSADASGSVTAISIASTNLNTTISGNTFTNLTVNSSGSFTFISHSFSMPANGTQVFENNSIVTAFNKTVANGTVTIFTTAGSSPSSAFTTYNNNNFSNITCIGTSAITGISNTDGAGTAPAKLVTNNIFSNWTAGTGAISCMSFTYWGGGVTNTISANTISNTSGGGSVTGISLGSSFSGTNPVDVSNNTVAVLSSSGSASSVVGITSTNASPSINIFNNIVRNFSSAGTTVTGISVSGSTANNIYNNLVHTLSSSNTNPTVSGIISAGGVTNTIYNNLVGHLSASSAGAANPIIGINVSGGTTVNASFNSVYLNNLSSTGSPFGATGVFASASTTFSMRNNVVRVTGTGAGGSNIAAYRRSSSTLSSYSTISNNNSFFAGSPSATNLIYVENTSSFTNPMQTMGDYKAFMGTRDQASVSIDPSFQSTVASSADFLKYVTTSATPLEAGGTPVSGITTDYAGTTRNVTTPDMGAWELNGIPLPACAAPAGQPTGLTLTPSSTSVSLSFTAAAGNPDNYLIIRTTSSAPPQNPVNGTSYAVGASALSGTIVSAGSSTITTDNSAVATTQYWYWIYSFNQSATCAGPVYNLTASPLSGTTTTCVLAPTAAAASNITGTGFTANWAGNVSATYTSFVLDVSTTNTFSSFVTGYNNLNVGNVTATAVTGLNSLTNYFYRVRGVGSSCFTSNTSTISLNTNGSVPWTEGFSTSTSAAPPVGWSGISSTTFQIGVPTGASGNSGNVLTTNLYNTVPSGTFSLPTFSNLPANSQFSFTYKIQNYNSPYAVPTSWGNFQFQISVNGGSFTNLGSSFTVAPSTFLSQSISLAAYAGSNIQIRLNASRTAGDFWLMFDDFSILAPCSVPSVPTALVFGTTGPGNVSMSFTPASTSPNGYMVVRYPAGSAVTAPSDAASYSLGQTLGLGTISNFISGTASSVLVSGLSPSTSYDFYIYPFNNVNCLGGPVFAGALSGTQSTSGCPVLNPAISIGTAGATYTSLSELSLILNGCPVSSPTVVTINPDYNPAGETFPIIFNNNTGASLTNTITIQPAGTVTSVITLSASSTSPLLDLSGARHFIFDGRPGGAGANSLLTVDNSGDGSALRLTGDAQNNIIRHITLLASNTSTTSGVVRITTAGGIALSNGNNNNTITNCNIDGKAVSPNGIYAAGSAAPADNKSNTISNNNIFNYYADPTGGVNNYGILLGGNNAVSPGATWTISGNSFYQTATRNYANATGIQIMAGIGGGFTPAGAHNITGNFFGGTLSGTGGTPLAITSVSAGTPHFSGIHMIAGTGTTTISGNRFANMNITTAQTSANQGMIMVAMLDNTGVTASSTTVVRIDNNTIGSTTAGGSIVYAGGASSAWSAINVGSFYSSQIGARAEITNNTIAGLTFSGGNSTSFRGINISSSIGIRDSSIITGNTIGAAAAPITMSGSGSLTGIVNNNSRGALINLNLISNIQSTNGSSSPSIIGINTAGGNATSQVEGNTITSLSTSALNTSTTTSPAIVGIQNSSTLDRVAGNSIFGLTASGNAGVSVHGIYNSGSVAQVNGNVIRDLFASSVSATGSVMNGVYANGGTSIYSNNLIRLGVQASPVANVINGIADVSGTNGYYYNSIFVGGAGVGTASSNTFAFSSTNTGTRDIRNNIFMNARSNATTGGSHFAIQVAGSTVAPSGLTLTNNDYFVNGTGGVFGRYNGAAVANLAAWRSTTSPLVSGNGPGLDLSSFSSNPNFIDPVSAVPSLLIDPVIPGVLESQAVPVTSISSHLAFDHSANPRSATTPDIGAFEFNGVSAVPVINTVSASATQCAASNHTITVTATQGAIPLTASMFTLNYSFNGVAQTPITIFTGSGSTFTATIPAATPSNATVAWSVTLNDGAFTVTRAGTSYSDDPLASVSLTAQASPSVACAGSTVTLTPVIASSNTSTIGAQTTTEFGGSVYRNGFGTGDFRHQLLYTAAELNAAGITGGTLHSITFRVTTAGSGAANNYTIKLANTSATSLGSTYLTGSFTNCYNATTYTAVSGDNTHNFSTPFVWDGVSSVLVDICYNISSTGGTSTVAATTPALVRNVNLLGTTGACTAATGSTFANRPLAIFGYDNSAPYSYSWSNGGNVISTSQSATVSPTVNSTYGLTITSIANGCTKASTVSVTVNPLPTAPTAINSNQCGAQVPLASVTDQNGFTNPVFRWYSAGTSTATLLQSSTSATYTGTIASTSTLYVSVVDPTTGCESLRTPVTVSVTQPNPLTAAATVTTVNCLGGGTSLSVTQTGTTNTYVLTWTASSYAGSGMSASTSATLNTPIALVPTAAGTYTFTVTGVEASTGCVAVSSVGVVVNDPLLGVTASASITPTVICAGAPTTLTMNLARTPLTESFDGDPLSQFTLSNVAGSGTVTTSTTYFSEGTGSVRLNAGTNADVRLVQNSSINLSNAASATLTFSHICASEDTYDFGVPIFSTDGGATWFAFPASSYQGSGTLAFANDIGFDKASYSDWNSTFTSSSSTPGTGPATSLWKTETIAIPAGVLTSTNFKVAFAYSTDGSVNYYGWLIDNVSLRIIPNATYSWSNGTSVVGTTNPLTITPAAGNYSLTGTATVGGCPISAAAVTLTVNPLPSVAAITGTAAVCVGNTTTLTNTTTGGVWTSANAAVATISSSGVVTGVTAGTSTITYTVTNATTGCVNSVTQLVTVNALPVVSTITGTASVCVGLTTTLSNTTAGGVWSSANSAIATVSATGVVSGISAGSVTISYTVTNSNNCVTTVTRVVTVNPLPVVPAITGASSVCMNSSITLANTTPNGVWTTSNSAVASVSSSGVVTGIAGGTAIITYTVTTSSGCVTAVSTVVTVNILPSVTGVITQPTTCVSFDGAINITAAGPAVGPYSYTWSTPNGIDPVLNAEDQTGLIVGDYNVVVTAANGCTVNRTFTLVGPGGCDICPTITSMTASPNPPCVGSPTTLTVSGLSDMGVTFGITFKMSTTPLTNPYTQGTVIQTVTNSGLSNGNTSATASVSFPAPGTYYVYSIITPQPLGVACRPTKSVTITVNPLPTVTAISNQIVASGSSTSPVVFAGGGVSATYNWTNSNTALIPISQGAGNIAAFAVNNSGTSPISTTIAAIATSPNAAGQSCVGTTATSFTITVNPVPTMAQPANTTLVNAIASTAINFATLNTGGTTTYAWTNSNPAIGLAASGTGSLPVFTPVNAGTAPVTATITVTPTYTNANGGPSTAGASREFTITVNPTAQVNTIANQFVCSGATLSSTVFGTVNTGGTTTYAWTNSNTAIGLAASGTGNIPAFAATNAQAGVISSTITVTPSYTNAGVTTAGTPVSYVITVNPAGQVNPVLSQVLCAGSTTTAATLSTTNQQGINVPASATASSGAISLAIPDNAPAGVTSTLPVSLPAGATVTGVRVTLNATHTWVSDLVINLRAPNGQVLNLFNGHGGSGDDLVNTVISSAGTASLASATAPFTGTFAATGALNVGATGQTSTTSGFPALYSGGSGNWVLSLRDQVGFDVGTLNSWAITVDYTTLLGGLTTYTWTNSNSAIGLAASGSGNTIAAFTASNTTAAPIVSTVTVTPTYTNGGLSCAGGAITYTYTVNPIPTVNVANQVLCAGTPATVNFTGATTGTVYNWTSSNAAIGLAVSGTGNLSFTPTNTTNLPISSTVVVTPVFTNAGVTCTGTPRTFTITVNPVGQVNTVLSQVLCNGANTTPVSFATVNGGGTVVAGTPVTANSGAITVAVPDASAAGVTHSLPVTLPAGATITGVSVNFNMTHTWLSDMVVNLRAPNGQVLNLVNRRGGSGDNFVNTTISSASTTSLATGAAPFTGTFAADAAPTVGPTGFEATATNFAALYSVANGNWTLGMRDYAAGDNGTLTGWSITFNYTTVEGAVTTYNWTNNTPSIGLAASGVGNIASFAAANTTAVPVTATVTVTPTYTNSGVGCAGLSTTFTYTVNPTPTVAAVSNQTVCRGASVAAINFAGTVSGTVYNWTNSNTAIGLGASGTGNIPSFVGTNTTSAPISATITVTPVSTINGITCTGTPRTFTITVNPIPTVNAVASFAICHNSPASVTFSGATTGTVYNWTNSNTTIGLGASGSGNLAFTALNTTSGPQVANIVVTPAFTNGGTTCTGTPTSFTITVNPLPVVSAGTLPARICISDTLVPLNGTPVGGSWSGIGTSGMSFVPTATAVGTWPITYTFADLNGCVNRATIPVTVLSCDERDRDLNSSGVQLYPNPNNGRFNLRVNSTRFNMLGMRVFNTAGQLVSVKQWSDLVFARVVPVDLSNLPAGIYMVRLYYGDGMDRGADKTFQVIIAR